MLRVRDEIKMTIAAYQTLYRSAVTFAMRKQLQAEQGKADLQRTLEQLEDKKKKLKDKKLELESKIEAILKRDKERKEVDEKNNAKEMEYLSTQNKQLITFLATLKASDKK